MFERYQFWGRNQNEGEPIDQWVTDLRTKAAKCEFLAHESDMIRDKIVFGVHDTRIKERLLREADLTLARALDICRAAETSKHQMDTMGAAHTQIHAMHTQKNVSHRGKTSHRPTSHQTGSNDKRESTCQYCGQSHAPRHCPAYGKMCKKCSGRNHFAVVCRGGGSRKPGGKSVHTVDSSDTSGLFIGTVFVGGIDRNEWHTTLKVNERDITFKLDTGADANVLPLDVYRQVLSDVPMTRTDTILTAFGNGRIHPEGEVKLEVKCKETSMTKLLSFYVTSASNIAILGCKACTAMNLVTRVAIDSVCNTTVLTKDSLLEIYGDVFTGIGEYKKPYHIEVDSSVPPVIQHCRKVPYARYDTLKQTLSDLEKKGIVASVDKPTDWVHNLVITEKRDGRMRVCLDPKPLNKAIKRERYEIPTPSDVQSRLSGMKIFTVIDMKDGYWHVKLSEESSYLCTFHTPWGRKRFLRMPFGISSASEVMQKRNEEAFSDIQGVNVIADDLIIAAINEIEHDAIMHRVLQRARRENVVFNAGKIQFKVTTVTYMGNIVTKDGMRPDPDKIEAIVNMPKPTDRQTWSVAPIGHDQVTVAVHPQRVEHHRKTAITTEARRGMVMAARA